MAAGSLRRRVTISVIAVFVGLLVAAGIAVDTTFTITTNRSENAVLADHIQIARDLAARNASPATLVNRVETRSVEADLVLADGETFGKLPSSTAASSPRVRHIKFANTTGTLAGARMSLLVNDGFLSGAQAKLRESLLIASFLALVLLAVLIPLVVRGALAPLDRMTSLARGIARGSRGDRIGRMSEATELGRVANAFDEMLDELEGAEQRAVKSEDSMRQFLSDAAHELRTPIAGISAAALAAMERSNDAAEHEQLLLLLGREAHRAGRFVEDLLDLARLDAGVQLERQFTDLKALIETHVDRTRLLHPQLNFSVTGHAAANIDLVRMGQVITNLLDNACAATPTGGQVSVHIAQTVDNVQISVVDSGPGVLTEDRDRIFDRLVRLDHSRDRAVGGTGLGLPIARGIARAHGGDLRCEEPSGAGARFVLTLPI